MRLSKKTKKLFYDKYVYKVAISTPLASYFRGANVENASIEIGHMLQRMEINGETGMTIGSNWNSRRINIQQIRKDLAVAHLLSGSDDHCIRVDVDTLCVYCNDTSVVDTVVELYRETDALWEVWRPETENIKEFLLNNPKQIMSAGYTHKYKVTINGLEDPVSFKTWAQKIPKLKVMSRNNYKVGGYFYVADQKTLSLCHIFLGNKIRRVDELRTHTEISIA